MSFDVAAIRTQFPILSREVNGNPLAYLDNASSVQKPSAVIGRVRTVWEGHYANVHRGLHTLANEATSDYEAARGTVARYLGAARDEEIVFTMGGTDAVNLVARSLGTDRIGEGDEIILSTMEHHSNIVPWHFLREQKGAVLKWLVPDADGRIEPDALASQISERTKMVAVTGMSNVLGTLPPLRALSDIAHEAGALFLVDGCQLAVHGRLDVQALGADFFVMTGHKAYGPNGIGALYGRYDLLAEMVPYRGGGEMIDKVTLDTITYNEPPHRFEAGTPPIAEAIGFGAALDWIMTLDEVALKAHERALTDHAMEALRGLNFIDLYGNDLEKGPVVAFNISGVHPHDISTILDQYGIAVRAGHHCCQPLMQQLGVSATARASFAAYNTHEEIDRLAEGLSKAQRMLG